MKIGQEIRIEDYLGIKTLILGDVNTGKTYWTREILAAMCRQGLGARMAIVDMAPEIPESIARARGLPGAGGKLAPPEGQGVLYLDGHFKAPRLSSKTEEEALAKARNNRQNIAALFPRLHGQNRDILFVNDISMFVQAGPAEELTTWLDGAATVIANGYWGEKLGEGILTRWERAEMGKLSAYFEMKGQVLKSEI
ncbi:MAG: hypothetical protein M0P16_09915 [Syntrophales bacterium]|jgi:hypothetical protein|nr:hypothetical protein [Syntrophales bacterium]MCK9391840.1 hypothetical protein [Syntrophales bacterium]